MNFLTGTLPELFLSFGSTGFGGQFCKVCSEGLIPKSTTTNFTLKGNFSCTYMSTKYYINLPIIKNGNLFLGNAYLTTDQCASLKKDSVNYVDEKKDLILS